MRTYCTFVLVMLLAVVVALLFGGLSDGGLLAAGLSGWSWNEIVAALLL